MSHLHRDAEREQLQPGPLRPVLPQPAWCQEPKVRGRHGLHPMERTIFTKCSRKVKECLTQNLARQLLKGPPRKVTLAGPGRRLLELLTQKREALRRYKPRLEQVCERPCSRKGNWKARGQALGNRRDPATCPTLSIVTSPGPESGVIINKACSGAVPGPGLCIESA